MNTNPPKGSEEEYKLLSIVFLCTIIALIGFVLGLSVSIFWTLLALTIALFIYVRTFHWHRRK